MILVRNLATKATLKVKVCISFGNIVLHGFKSSKVLVTSRKFSSVAINDISIKYIVLTFLNINLCLKANLSLINDLIYILLVMGTPLTKGGKVKARNAYIALLLWVLNKSSPLASKDYYHDDCFQS